MFGIFSPSSLEWVFLVALWFLACVFLLCGKLSTCLLCSCCVGTMGIFSMGVVWGCKFVALDFWEGGGLGACYPRKRFNRMHSEWLKRHLNMLCIILLLTRLLKQN